MSEVEKYRKNLVCLVPKAGSNSVITSHEKTLCDCEVLEIISAFDRVVEALKFYGGVGTMGQIQDGGRRAREALKDVGVEV